MDFDLKERVRSAVDIVDVIGSSLTLQPKGRLYVGQCPWHDDRSPSLQVNRERQSWKCWPCDIGGDVFSFVMRRDGVDFVTALKLLAEQAGIEFQAGSKVEAGSPEDKSTLLRAAQLIADAYFRQLDDPQSEDARIARAYLDSRGIDDENRRRFQIGFAPDSWSFAVDLLKKNDFRPEIAAAAGVAFARREGTGSYDMFRGRLMFPIHDMQGRTISMGGRLIPQIAERHGENAGGKYINGPETLLFRKSHTLYGLNLAREPIRKRGQALVMEGYTDVVAARQHGIEPVVAVLGTALGADHVEILKRLTQRVVLILDGDDAGQKRADEVLQLFVQADADLRILTLPDGMDPADYLNANGQDAFNALVAEAPDCLSHKLTRLTQGVDLTSDTHAVMNAIDTMVGVIASAPKMDPVKQDQLLIRLSRTFGIGVEKLSQRVTVRRAELAKQHATRARFRIQQERQQRQSQATAKGAGTRKPAGQKPPPDSFDPNQLLLESGESEGLEGGFVAEDWEHPTTGADDAVVEVMQQPLDGIDRELFEILIESPELAARAVESVDQEWLETVTAKVLLSAYQELELEGRDLHVDVLLLLLENDFLKNQVTTLQFRIAQRADKLPLSAEERYHSIIAKYREREADAEKLRQISQLATTSLAEEEELELLQKLFESEKLRQQLAREESN